MAKGSQLAQLKSSLAESGSSRKPKTKSNKRKRSSSQPGEPITRLSQDVIHKLNPFDLKVTKLKHDVGGRKIKGQTGKPALKNQAGLEQRKKTLLVELGQRNRSGGIVDRRFGENNPSMTPEERMLERFTKERQRASRASLFNLEEEDELTHYGQSLSNLDDFSDVGMELDDEEEDDFGKIDAAMVSTQHFGGFDEETEGDEETQKKKSKAEVMSEVIAKSKQYKVERQKAKEDEESLRHELDQEFSSIQALLAPVEAAAESTSSTVNKLQTSDNAYDRIVHELAYEARANPKDRTKTEEELAAEKKLELEKAERRRLRRMQGLSDDESETETRRSRKRKREGGGDDLVDDYVPEWGGLGEGLTTEVLPEDTDQDDASLGSNDDCTGTDSSDESGSSEDDSPVLDGDKVIGDQNNSVQDDHGSRRLLDNHRPTSQKPNSESNKLPYTFPCPESHEEWLEIIGDINDSDLGTVVTRIMALYHPSLATVNKARLQTFCRVLVEHVLYVSLPPHPRFAIVNILTPHIFKLIQMHPQMSAQMFVEKLVLMEKNLSRGVKHDPTSSKARTWPGTAELVFLRLLGVLWSTSDMKHDVAAPAKLLMGAYLELGRIRDLKDITSGLFLCTLLLQYEDYSHRFVPEAVSFLLNSILIIGPHRFHQISELPETVFSPEFGTDVHRNLSMNKTQRCAKLDPIAPDLPTLLFTPEEDFEQSKVNLLDMALNLLGKYAEMYKNLNGFVELYRPVVKILEKLDLHSFSAKLQHTADATLKVVSNLLKFAQASRQPLLLQSHKPLPIATYIPKFSTSSSTYLHAKDPDHERAKSSKLRREYKQERKGALRELRKDARFMARYQQEKQEAKDKAYNLAVRRAVGSIEGERAEEKKMLREKMKEHRRAGRK